MVQPLSTSGQRFLLGYDSGNGGKIFSAAQSLHMSGRGITEVYMGLSNVRGIAVDVWQSCQYWKNMDATMNVYWYFSGKSLYSCCCCCCFGVVFVVLGVDFTAPVSPNVVAVVLVLFLLLQ